jgi:hypothetical protein
VKATATVNGTGLVDSCVTTVQSTTFFPVFASRTFVRFTIAANCRFSENYSPTPLQANFCIVVEVYPGGGGFRGQYVPARCVTILLKTEATNLFETAADTVLQTVTGAALRILSTAVVGR